MKESGREHGFGSLPFKVRKQQQQQQQQTTTSIIIKGKGTNQEEKRGGTSERSTSQKRSHTLAGLVSGPMERK